MKSSLRIWTILMMIGVLSMVSCGLTPDQIGVIVKVGTEILLSSKDAQETNLAGMDKEKWRRYLNQFFLGTRSVSPGPNIVMETPEVKTTDQGQTVEMVSPAKLKISFKENPKSGKPVDMASLTVRAVKYAVSIPLTEKLRPYVKETTLEAEKVEIPTGKFHIEISIADKDGQKTVENYLFVVAGR